MPHMIATIRDQSYEVDIDKENPLEKITLNGQEHTFDWKQMAPLAQNMQKFATIGGRYSLLLTNKSYEVFTRRITVPGEDNSYTYEIFLNGVRFEVSVEDERMRALAGLLKESAHSGGATIYAPMPGLVTNVLLEVGAEVKAGQPVVVLEAMKMENDLSSPVNGKIKEIKVDKGQTVDLGAALVVIDG